jgi:hypothetical protein
MLKGGSAAEETGARVSESKRFDGIQEPCVLRMIGCMSRKPRGWSYDLHRHSLEKLVRCPVRRHCISVHILCVASVCRLIKNGLLCIIATVTSPRMIVDVCVVFC